MGSLAHSSRVRSQPRASTNSSQHHHVTVLQSHLITRQSHHTVPGPQFQGPARCSPSLELCLAASFHSSPAQPTTCSSLVPSYSSSASPHSSGISPQFTALSTVPGFHFKTPEPHSAAPSYIEYVSPVLPYGSPALPNYPTVPESSLSLVPRYTVPQATLQHQRPFYCTATPS